MGIAIYFDGGEGVITFTAIVDCRLMIQFLSNFRIGMQSKLIPIGE